MRALLINQFFYPSSQSTGQHLSGLAEALTKRGYEVTVLTSRRSDHDPNRLYPARETWRGIQIIRVWNSHLGRKTRWRRAVDFLSFLLFASWRGLVLPGFDLVVTLTSPPLISVLGAVLARLWGARFIYWVMDLFPDEAVAIGWLREDAFMTRVMEKVSRWSLGQADCVIVLDDYMRDRLIGKGITPKKIASIPIWMHEEVTFDSAGSQRFRRKHQLDDKYIVMYSGNHSPCHPLHTLVEAAKFLRNDPRLHFCFVGGGNEWDKLWSRARQEGWANTTFLGYQPFEELSASLSAADTQVVVMGDPFVGIIHPCKVYNFLAAQRPFIYVGPEKSHVMDLIRDAGLKEVAASFRHGESRALAEELQRRAHAAREMPPAWPPSERINQWSETAILAKMVSVLDGQVLR